MPTAASGSPLPQKGGARPAIGTLSAAELSGNPKGHRPLHGVSPDGTQASSSRRVPPPCASVAAAAENHLSFEVRAYIKAALNERARKRENLQVRDEKHGTEKNYRNGCSCRRCIKAHSDARRHRKQRQLEREQRIADGTYMPHNAVKTHCVRGHEFTPENTYVFGGSHRQCRECRRLLMNESNLRNRFNLEREAA